MSRDTTVQDKVQALIDVGLRQARGGPVERLAAKMNAANPGDLVTVRFKCRRDFLDMLDYHASQTRYSRAGLIKLSIKLLLEAIGAQLDSVPEDDESDAEGGE